MVLEFREAIIDDLSDIAELSISSWKNSFDEFIQKDVLDKLSLENAIQVWKISLLPNENKQRIILAIIKDCNNSKLEIVGFINFGHSISLGLENLGEIVALHVLKKYHKLGIGRQLVSICLNTLFLEGCQSIISWVLEGNLIARKFFEQMGGEYFTSGTRVIGGKNYNQNCFLWKTHILPKHNTSAPAINCDLNLH